MEPFSNLDPEGNRSSLSAQSAPVVLVIDDAELDASLFRGALADVAPEIDCHTFRSGKHATGWLSTAKPADYVLIDVSLLGEDGTEVASRIQQLFSFSNDQIGLWSGDPLAPGRASDAWTVIEKPFDLSSLKALASKVAAVARSFRDQRIRIAALPKD